MENNEGGSPVARAVVITISDSVSSGHREDRSGDAVEAILAKAGFDAITRIVLPDDRAAIKNELLRLRDAGTELIVTTGGTGLGPRDVTPEATEDVLDRRASGLAEAMRAEGLKKTPFASLSRGTAGVAGSTLVLNLPGSPKGALESLEAVVEVLPHALRLLAGHTGHHES
jgi:molybdenum cofactor synthesis domain-containing protein